MGFGRRHGSSASDFLPDLPNGCVDIGPCRLVRRKLPPQIGDQFRDLPVAQAVPEGRAYSRGRCDAGVAMPCRMTWIRLSGVALCRLLFSASEGRLPNSGAPPTSWHTAQAPW